MNGFYLTEEAIDLNDPDLTSGITKKILAQAKVFNEMLGCELMVMKCHLNKMPRLWRAIWTRLPYTGIANCWLYEDSLKGADYIYIRRGSVDQSFIRFIKKIKKNSPNTKLILELPNYPYNLGKGRYGRFGFPYYLKNKFGVSKFQKYIDRIVTYSDHEIIFDIPTIRINNGIDISSVRKRIVNIEEIEDTIRLIGVAQVRMWHGYDRFIEGLYAYYQNGGTRKICFDIVGDIMHSYDYETKVKKYNLENNIFFHGRKSGQDLDELYDQNQMGIDAFATHRTGGQKKSCSLKTREYFAKGLPFVTAIEISDVDEKYPYVKYFPQGEEPIDIADIIGFYDSLYQGKEDYLEVNETIRAFAEKNCDWRTTLIPVITYIQGHDK